METGWKRNVRRVVPYVPGEQPHEEDMIKLNTNENPYPPAPGVQNCLDRMRSEEFRLYPNTDAAPVAEALAEHFGMGQERFFVGVGSDDVLATAFLTFFNGSEPVLFPDITYSFYEVWADLYQIPYRKLPLDGNFRIHAGDYRIPNGGIVIANPNAPTGIYEPLSFIEEILKQNTESLVIVDEAYIDFAGASAILLTEKYDNLLVVQTFSKSRSMAGMRIGYAVGQPELISAMNAVKFSYNSYTMNLPAQLLGAEAVRDEAYFRKTVEKIVETREQSKRRMANLGFRFTDSGSNFLFVTHPEVQAEYLLAELHKIDGLKEVRGRGLMIGIEIDGSGPELRKRLLFEKHIFTGGAGASTVRLLPALCLTREMADRFLNAFKEMIR